MRWLIQDQTFVSTRWSFLPSCIASASRSRHPGYEASQRTRKRIEEPFGWGKTIGGLARPMLRGIKKLDFKFTLTMAGYNLIRLPKLLAA